MDSDESTATKEIARMLLEQLQESGERDRMKEWLFRELDTAGWKKSLSEQASKIVKARNAESESKEAAHDGNSSSAARGTSGKITAKELATNLSAFGHDNVPERIRARLLHDILVHTRSFVTSKGYAIDGEEPERQ